MDEYGIYENKPEDFAHIAWNLRSSGSVVFSYSEDKCTNYICFMSCNWKATTEIPWGGKPTGILFGVLRHGWFWFAPTNKHYSYIAEKLGILSKADALAIGELWNGVIEQLEKPVTGIIEHDGKLQVILGGDRET